MPEIAIAKRKMANPYDCLLALLLHPARIVGGEFHPAFWAPNSLGTNAYIWRNSTKQPCVGCDVFSRCCFFACVLVYTLLSLCWEMVSAAQPPCSRLSSIKSKHYQIFATAMPPLIFLKHIVRLHFPSTPSSPPSTPPPFPSHHQTPFASCITTLHYLLLHMPSNTSHPHWCQLGKPPSNTIHYPCFWI